MKDKQKTYKEISSKKGKLLNLDDYPNFHKSGSVIGMRKLYYGKNALLLRCGNYIYNLSSNPDLFNSL